MAESTAAVARPWNSEPLYMRPYHYQRGDAYLGVGEGAILVTFCKQMPNEPLSVTVTGPKATETAKLYAVAPTLYEACEHMRLALGLMQDYAAPRQTRGFEADNQAGFDRAQAAAAAAIKMHDEVCTQLHTEPGQVGSFNFTAVVFKNFSYLLARSKSIAGMCGNVIYNTTQHASSRTSHEEHIRSWKGIKEDIDASIKNVDPSWTPEKFA